MEFVRDTLLSLEMPPVLHRPLSTKPDSMQKIPLDGVIKLNFDGAMAIQEGVAGGGDRGAARDSWACKELGALPIRAFRIL
jgi:hypothetical protein